MGWPIDTVYESVVAGMVIRAATMLQVQNRVVDVAGGRRSIKQALVDGVGDQAVSLSTNVVLQVKKTLAIGGSLTDVMPAILGIAPPQNIMQVIEAWPYVPGPPVQFARRYVDVTGKGYTTFNAEWDDGNNRWKADDDTQAAALLELRQDGAQVLRFKTAAANWTSWDRYAQMLPYTPTPGGGGLELDAALKVTANAAASSSLPNPATAWGEIWKGLVPLAYAEIDGTGAIVGDSINIKSVVRNFAGNYTIELVTGAPNKLLPFVQLLEGAEGWVAISAGGARTTTLFTVNLHMAAGGGLADKYFCVVVFGR